LDRQTPEQTHIIEILGVRKAFAENPVVHGIDLKIPQGGCFGLLGPNGAGKTTILRMLLGQSPVTAGALSVLGHFIPESVREIRARTGVVPQLDNLDPDFTVRENLEVYASYFGLAGKAIEHRIEELLDFVELAERKQAKINTLSGGMKRRLSIARSLINAPELLILDEPTTGLDPQARHLIWRRLRELKKTGTTLLLTTHYMEEAERLCDDLVIIDKGKILSQGHPKALIRQHVEPDVVEIHEDPDQVSSLLALNHDIRTEIIDQSIYCYTHLPVPLLKQLEARPGLTYFHRPANLEDVFLKLTGRELRDE